MSGGCHYQRHNAGSERNQDLQNVSPDFGSILNFESKLASNKALKTKRVKKFNNEQCDFPLQHFVV